MGVCADVGVKKGEKVDYAILREGKPVILFECKHHNCDLGKVQASQLYRYFSVTDARFGVLTNGLLYWFYTDLEASNKMDEKPFFEFNMLDIKEPVVEELKKFSKSSFDLDFILTTAAELKFTREIKRLLLEQLQEPAEDFVRFFVSRVYSGRMTQPVREQFTQLIKQAFKYMINDQINERLKTAMASENAVVTGQSSESVKRQETQIIGGETQAPGATETTQEEWEAFYIVRAILREIIPPKRVALRDVQSYCGVLLDDNNRKPICRLHFSGPRKLVSLFDTGKEERVQIEALEDLYSYADRIKTSALRYEGQNKTDKNKVITPD